MVSETDQPWLGHNRWHPEIPPIDEVWPGDEIILEMPAFDDYQLTDTDGVQEILSLDHLSRVHPLAGPIYVHGAEPGDLLVVDILEIEPLSGVGYCCNIPVHVKGGYPGHAGGRPEDDRAHHA